jgi:signal transduction histidine kinase
MGLLPALISYFQRFKRNYDIEVHFSHNLTGERYHPSIENSAFRIIQESLTNIARHAQVKDATVRLWCDEHCLGLQVVDDGAGFDLQAALASGLSGGLSGIKERVSLYHGQLEIETQPGAGCRITAEFPLDHNAEIG